jgi:hypothetical protein
MRSLNLFKLNVFSNIIFVLLALTYRVVLRFDPAPCSDTGLCQEIVPSPFYFQFAYYIIFSPIAIAFLVAMISLLGLVYKKIVHTAEFSWWRIFLALIISSPATVVALDIIGKLLF